MHNLNKNNNIINKNKRQLFTIKDISELMSKSIKELNLNNYFKAINDPILP